MKLKILFLLIAPILILGAASSADKKLDYSLLKEGDIIFQETRSQQATAIKLATKSRYTHVGMIIVDNGKIAVIEAIQPVKITTLKGFLSRGVNKHFAVMRLIDSENLLTPESIKKMKARGKSMLGKNYDIYFEWSDKKIYCTELVWKIYNAAGINICELEKLGEFDLSHPFVKNLMKQRYGNNIPFDEPVVSPGSMFSSPKLRLVYSN